MAPYFPTLPFCCCDQGCISTLGSPGTRHVAILPHSACFVLAVIGCTPIYGSHRTRCGAALPLVEVG